MRRLLPVLLLLLSVASAHAAETLRVVSAGPVGEIANLTEANEIRVVFSEPMVVVGKVPKELNPAWFRITPAVTGTFRWSGTTTLIFTPKQRMPHATPYTVNIDTGATSVAGNKLQKPYRWSFSTPTVKLQHAAWYRKDARPDSPILIGLFFNQPVKADAILPNLQLSTVPREFKQPEMPAAGAAILAKREPQALQVFEEKRAKAAKAAAAAGAPVFAFLATEWNTLKFPAAPHVVVIETRPGVLPDTSILVRIAAPKSGDSSEIRSPQEYTVELNPTLFIERMQCEAACDPDTYNAIVFRAPNGLRYESVRRAVKVFDITDPAKEVALKQETRERDYDYPTSEYGLDELGFSLRPSRRYLVRVGPDVVAEDGQKLGYTWMTVIENWHRSAFISFGDGQGVWEADGGPLLPFHARNLRTVKQWLAPISIEQMMPTLLRMQKDGFRSAPLDAKPLDRKLTPGADKIQSYGVDVTPVTGTDGFGLGWIAVEPGEMIPKARIYDPSVRSTIVQVTNLGISAKDSPLNTLVMVTRLDNGTPVAGANVSIRTTDNKIFWSGTTDASGIVVAPNTKIRNVKRPAGQEREQGEEQDEDWWRAYSDFHFIIVAEKDGDVAYVGSDWNEGISPWELGVDFDISESQPLLRGTVFTDRGVYKPGEEVHFKAVLRTDTPTGMKLLDAGSKAEVIVRDSQDREIDRRTITMNEWSSGEWTWKVPSDATLGTYAVLVSAAGQRLRVYGDFLVAAYRRPEFRVDVDLGADSTLAGTKLDGKIVGRYLFGGAMSGRDVTWSYSKVALYDVPAKIESRWPSDRYTFLGCFDQECRSNPIVISSDTKKLNTKGELSLKLDTELKAGEPYAYRLEGDVTDVTRQHIANRTAFAVDPAPWYIGVKTPPYFGEVKNGFSTDVVAAGLDGLAVPGVEVTIDIKRMQWVSSRRAEGEGFYEWDSDPKEVDVETRKITTGDQPVPVNIPLREGGEYRLYATATDAAGRSTTTKFSFYAIGDGYTAWERYDHNRIDLIPEKKLYKPGETARIMVKSPWERATALLTTEREGVRTWKQFELTSTQQTITVPITESEIPNVYVSVLLVKGRTKQEVGADGSDPGKPAFRLGYTKLKVEDATKRLKVTVKANRDEFRPATKAKIEVNVRDAAGKGTASEVTLWAVDYGVLSLTGYRTPDVLDSIYLEKALQVVNEDSRQRIISRRVLTPKGAADGGGGGRDPGAGALRKDFRVLAFWLGSLVTDSKGNAKTDVTLPESLTTYRIMAVAGDKASRFGWGQNEIRINKPLMITAAFPRFLAVGDKAYFGAVVHNQVKKSGTATVTIRSLDPSVLEFTGAAESKIEIKPGSANEVRFDAVAKSAGSARVQVRVSGVGENDAFEDVIPVRVLTTPETTAAYGEAKPQAKETVEIPANVVPGYGGMRLELASTAMVGLAEGARYLVEYPYGCAEQRASGALALMLAGNLGDAFKLPGIDGATAKQRSQAALDELRKFQCANGGFAFWAGDCWSVSPYLTSWVLHVMQTGQKLGYRVDADTLARGYAYLEAHLEEKRPTNESFMRAYTAWQAFSVKVLAQGGRNVDAHITRLVSYADRMPVFALAHLSDALAARGDRSTRGAEVKRRMVNAILPEGGFAHVQEVDDDYLRWLWNSNVRTTAMVLGTLVRRGEDEELVKRMVRWMMKVRKDGRWGNTQENAWAMDGLVEYYRKYESEVPDFTGVVTFGTEQLAQEAFRGRSADARVSEVPMTRLLAKGAAGQQVPLLFDRQGTGTLFYLMRLRYAVDAANLAAVEQGFRITRQYRVQGAEDSVTTFGAGALIEVTLTIRNTKERRFVAVTDPIPAGTEAVETWFATTAQEIGQRETDTGGEGDWTDWWRRGGFDRIERHDDRVNLFATRLAEGSHVFTYLVRATTAGSFVTAPAYVEEMYEPEVFGRTASSLVEVKR